MIKRSGKCKNPVVNNVSSLYRKEIISRSAAGTASKFQRIEAKPLLKVRSCGGGLYEY